MHLAVVVKNLGVWFDANFTFADHVHNICKTCFIQICDLRWVSKHLTDEAAILAANALVTSCLDYCNSLFRSLFSLNMNKVVSRPLILALPGHAKPSNLQKYLTYHKYIGFAVSNY